MQNHIDPNEKTFLPTGTPGGGLTGLVMFIVAAVGIGVACIAASMAGGEGGGDAMRRFLLAYLTAFAFVLSLSLGGLFFCLVTHLTRAGWSPVVRRPAEVLASSMWVCGLLFLPIVVSVISGHGKLYPWAQPLSAEVHHADAGGVGEVGDAGGAGDVGWVGEQARALAYAAYDDASAYTATTASIVRVADPVEPEGDRDHDGHDDDDHDDHGDDDHDHGAAGKPHAEDGDHDAHGQAEAHGGGAIYPHHELDAFTLKKRAYLNAPFFILRWVFYITLWTCLGYWYLKNSVTQDRTGDYKITMKLEKWSAPIALVFALSFTFAAWDLMMTLNPHWYSTIFGVYYFAGTAIAIFAALTLILMGLQSAGYLKNTVTVEHYHDLGKLMFAFTFFWTYIAFSQYMLLWYASLPETTQWLTHRGMSTVVEDRNGWGVVLLALLFGHFVFPFLGLLSRHVKRNKAALAFFAVWMLAMHYMDLYWLIMPETGPEVVFGLVEIGTFVAVLSLFGLGVMSGMRRQSLVCQQDPRMADSIHHEGLY